MQNLCRLLLLKENLWSSQVTHTHTHPRMHTRTTDWGSISYGFRANRWTLVFLCKLHAKRHTFDFILYIFLWWLINICYFWVPWRNFHTRDSFWEFIEFKLKLTSSKSDHIWWNRFLIDFSFFFLSFFCCIENLKSSTTQCWPKPVFITTAATILNWALLAENTSVSAHSQSPIQAIQISFVPCLKHKLSNRAYINFWNSMESSKWHSEWHFFI